MKAYSLHAVNDLKYDEVAYPDCPTGWCIVKVKAAGICSSDIPRIFTKGTYHFPTTPGHEFSGIVDKVADKENECLLGKKVGVFPLIPCKKCPQCATGHYEMCSDYDYIGSRRDGGFAEYVAVPVWNLVEFSGNAEFKEIAMMEPLSVALHAVKQAGIKEGDSVAIVGTGMIGFAAAQWAQKLKAENVTVIGRSFNKKVLAEAIGNLDYRIMDEVENEFDVVIEAVGSNNAIDKSINIVKAGGTLVLMGNPEGEIDLLQNTYWRILRKQLHIVGTWNSHYESTGQSDWSEVKEALNSKSIKVENLISHTYGQENLKDGLEVMKSHKEPYCKVMTVWNEQDEVCK